MDDILFDPPEIGCVLSLTGRPFSGSSILDNSPYGNSGTISGATWVRSPSGLWCLSFDGSDDYVNCGNASSLRSTAELTVIVWMNITEPSTQYTIIQRGGSADWSLNVTGSGWNNKIDARIGGAAHYVDDTFPSSNYNKWTCVAFTFHDARDSLYQFVNGDEVYSRTNATAQIPTSSNDLIIGRYSETLYKTEGLLALIRVYNRTLSALEIQNHFNREKHLFGIV